MHVILSEANKEGAVFQFHTGIQVGQGNIIPNSNPELLTNIFIEYQNIKFDIISWRVSVFLSVGGAGKTVSKRVCRSVLDAYHFAE